MVWKRDDVAGVACDRVIVGSVNTAHQAHERAMEAEGGERKGAVIFVFGWRGRAATVTFGYLSHAAI